MPGEELSKEKKELEPRILRFQITGEDAGRTIKEYLMKKIGFSSRQLSRFKYRKDGMLLNGEKRYVNAPLRTGDLLEIRLTQGGEPAERHPQDAMEKSQSRSFSGEEGGLPGRISGLPADGRGCAGERSCLSAGEGYLPARDGRLQKIWAPPAAWLNEKYPFRILYEDQDILAADKPSGVVCHPSPGHFDDTLSNQLAEHLGRIGRELDVRVTGRLDRDTSGIVIFALNTETAAQLIKQRQASMMQKIYIARVRGLFPENNGEEVRGIVDRPLRRESRESFRMVIAEDGKPARTFYQVLAGLEDGTTVVACRIEHGRTHQIRVHMASIGHPIVGDRLYGPEAAASEGAGDCEEGKPGLPHGLRQNTGEDLRELGRREEVDRSREKTEMPPLMLHAFRAVLRQPFSGEEIRLEAPLPAWAEAGRWERSDMEA